MAIINYYQNISDHIVQIVSNSICETNEKSIPTGKMLNIKNTKFDLNNSFLINNDFFK